MFSVEHRKWVLCLDVCLANVRESAVLHSIGLSVCCTLQYDGVSVVWHAELRGGEVRCDVWHGGHEDALCHVRRGVVDVGLYEHAGDDHDGHEHDWAKKLTERGSESPFPHNPVLFHEGTEVPCFLTHW